MQSQSSQCGSWPLEDGSRLWGCLGDVSESQPLSVQYEGNTQHPTLLSPGITGKLT